MTMKRSLLVRAIVLGSLLAGTIAVTPAAQADGPGAIQSIPGGSAYSLAANDDGSSAEVTLPFPVNFFGTTYTSLYVNNNGNVTFDAPRSTFTPQDLTSSGVPPIIAPFFADVDTREGAVVTYGISTDNRIFAANWINVGYYSHHTDKLNSFQLLIVNRATGASTTGNFDIVFNYDKIQWETGDASQGSGGFGGISAAAGYSNGTGAPGSNYQFPGSRAPGSFLDSSAGGLIHNSRNAALQLGRYVFQVRGGEVPVGGTIDGTVYANVTDAAHVVQGAFVEVTRPSGPNVTVTTNALGQYEASGLPAGTYTVSAWPPTGSSLQPGTAPAPVTLTGNETKTAGAIVLSGTTPIPPDTTITSRDNDNGIPILYWGEPLTLTHDGPAGSAPAATYAITLEGQTSPVRSGSMTENPPGHYAATIEPLAPIHGRARIVITLHLPGGDQIVPFDVYIDPSGTVRTTKAEGGEPLAGVTVTLYRSDSPEGPFEPVPNGSGIMSVANRTNPDVTDADGRFGWDVVAGYYKVRAEKTGYRSPADPSASFSETPVLTIPPAVTDLDLRLLGREVRRADALIGLKAATGFAGDGIYNTTGKRQSKALLPRTRSATTFYVKVQNDGNVRDSIAVRAPQGSEYFRMKYLLGAKDVTAKIVSGRFVVSLAPGASKVLRVVMTVLPAADPGDRWSCLVQVGSKTASSARDAVKALVTVKR